MRNSSDVTGNAVGGKTVTVADVATAAGVSPSTVSYVLTGKRPISPRTRRRVMESIRTLGYRRPGAPGSASGCRVGVVAVAVPPHGDQSTGTGAEFVAGAVEAARGNRLDLLLLTQDTGGDALHRVFHAALADAAIVMDVEADDPRVPPLLAARVPAVLVGGQPTEHPALAHLGFDYPAAAAACVAHLAELGHRSIVHIGQRSAAVRTTAFAAAFAAAAGHRGIRASSHPVGVAGDEIEDRLARVLAEAAPTGLVVDDEAALPRVLAALANRGLDVPGDLSVVAVCSETVANARRLPLTAVLVPGRTLGRLAVELLARQLEVLTPPSAEVLSPEVIIGGSTAPAAGS
ncbi:LacI family DNA-binding transcriptional regulator [Amycolatopsis tolypomycina]|uniref:DNA-binding transcriptional regulator, LacI/PurR family n=1 Tax=Amycolatopsis tolypomycina TaxID=208445 RepID=A0A1H4SQN8_9PSEU|nr:LacI family DNA-binding transcriptional regulator [Amycolatopsis tolypomycina]SEC46456.1 DNA-binding transcriptional regulator, LacI/PurR family [Amycolatopsis tolypomycina]